MVRNFVMELERKDEALRTLDADSDSDDGEVEFKGNEKCSSDEDEREEAPERDGSSVNLPGDGSFEATIDRSDDEDQENQQTGETESPGNDPLSFSESPNAEVTKGLESLVAEEPGNNAEPKEENIDGNES